MKTVHLTFAAALLVVGSFFAPAAHAQAPLKIGYTSVEYVLSQMPERKQIESDLKTYSSQLESQMKAKQTDFQTKLDAYQKATQGGTPMTAVVKADREKELQTLQQGLQEFSSTAQQSLQQKQQQLLSPALDKIQKNIDLVANENGYTYVLNSDAGSSPILLHGPKDGDISDLILKKMGITPTAPAPTPDAKPATQSPATKTPAAPATAPTKAKGKK
ncbi:OmpH family outer membrane protein [Hymenobacter setariae]|uniref:OmpH family outer membrane protein n=1 Tax=Hymenobacter setariae TaxID=2594794 RepID=A0A558BV23_9BACT|nr:OmpH family outer membrane protein [Hymenobacter setariae]TVT40339.1 OmpH family outer membrane protein [Hymenobacter setariae]